MRAFASRGLSPVPLFRDPGLETLARSLCFPFAAFGSGHTVCSYKSIREIGEWWWVELNSSGKSGAEGGYSDAHTASTSPGNPAIGGVCDGGGGNMRNELRGVSPPPATVVFTATPAPPSSLRGPPRGPWCLR